MKRRCECPPEAEHVPGCPELTAEPTWLEKRRDERGILPHPRFSRELGEESEDPLVRDVAFNRHSMNDGEHVGPSDNGKISVGTDNIEVVLVQGIDEDAFKRTLSMATRATIGLDLKTSEEWVPCEEDALHFHNTDEESCVIAGKVHHLRTHSALDDVGDWEEMLKGGLQTALETQVIVFAVSGVSRTATHQLVRSRRAAFHQQSQRASYMGDFPECRMPDSIWRNPKARKEFTKLVMQSWKTYQACCEEDISYQDSRFALLEGTTNFIMLEYPVREFLNVYAYRGCSMFQWEIVRVMRECRRVLVEAHPWIEPYVKISCEKTGPATIPTPLALHQASCDVTRDKPCSCGASVGTVAHHCTFQGWEDVEGQCDFPWAKQEARTFKPSYHRISRKGGE